MVSVSLYGVCLRSPKYLAKVTDAEPLFNSSDAREDFLSYSSAVSQAGCLLEADVTILAIREFV